MESKTQFVISSETPSHNSAKTLESNDENPRQTLVSVDQDSHTQPQIGGEIPDSDNKQGTLVPQNEKSVIEISKPLLSGNGLTQTHSGTDKDCSGGEEETISRRRRRKSRWDPPPNESNDGGTSDGNGTGGRKKKSRWADDAPAIPQIPDFMINLTGGLEFDPEVQSLNSRLLEINRKLLSGLPLDDRPEGARSPSPEPIYDTKGIRVNTRENRAKERLSREKQEIIQQIIKKNPAFKPPADYRPPKLQKKLYIPMKEYPGYNFIGLIIGPRGNTQKRMAKETGAKIVIRGKGSVKEGRLQQKRDLNFDPAENEDLHVLVEADTQESLDAAVGMVEKLLQPVDEVLNEHKRQQLRELAALNGTIKDEEYCRLCGEQGHRQFACPSRFSTFKSDVLCKICGDGGHPTIDCPVKGTTGKKMDDEYQNFLAELGGSMPEGLTKSSSTTLALGGPTQEGLGANQIKPPIKEYDETNLYIGYLPPTLEDDGLIRLFSPYGTIVNAKVVKDKVTGTSKGYGFVKYSDVKEANTAISSMNGQSIEGRTIAVRVAGKPPQPVAPPNPPPSTTPTFVPPANNYAVGPVPWGPPSSNSYSNFNYNNYPPPPPPPGATMYTPYGVQYPPPMVVSSGAPSQVVSSGVDVQYPPGVQSHGSIAPQPLYTTPSFSYAPYYGVNPPQPPPPPPPSFVPQSPRELVKTYGNVPWATNPSVPPPPVSANEKTPHGKDDEYEKFMAEMK